MSNKKVLVENRINDFLNNAKVGNLGYICIKLNGNKVNYFNINDVECENGLQKPLTEEIADKILSAKRINVDGDYYGEGRTGFLIEDLDFITEY
jgi:abc transporter ATP-binding and permease protein